MQPALKLAARSIERPRDAGWTSVATLDAVDPARVDAAGLVTPCGAGWSLDWWIGADDRWYLPAREPTVRQRRLGAGPVIETTVRIPSGDARQTVYGALLGTERVTVVEVHNDSPVPVALAVAVRPYTVDGVHDLDQTRLIQVDGRVVRVGRGPTVVLPRPPNESGGSATIDMVDEVLAGAELGWDPSAAGEVPNGVLLYPLPHRTSLRFLILGTDPGESLPSVDAAPDAETVARGWTSIVEGVTRFEFPDPGLTGAMNAARARLLLAAPDLAASVSSLRPGAGCALAGLGVAGHRAEVDAALAELAETFPTRLEHGPQAACEVMSGMTLSSATLGIEPSPALLETAVQVTHLIERAAGKRFGRRRRADEDPAARLARRNLADLAEGSAVAGADHIDLADPVTVEEVTERLAAASPSGAWGEDRIDEAGRFVTDARSLLIDDRGPDLILFPRFPSGWRGGGAEVHRAPTRHGVVSFAVRWHGARPALLWDLEDGSGVTLRCPALDDGWSSDEPKGETLLSGSSDPLPSAPMPGDSFS